MRDVQIRGDMIRLGQFLKLADVMESGGESKELILDGEVSVNGEVDTRRGRHCTAATSCGCWARPCGSPEDRHTQELHSAVWAAAQVRVTH
ncbi:RNA-binding S4 domain-containing protein [Dactylosporangium darangshiense]|uniref:RNA-binding S4 domain-containing protein n=1 Tax=Dactylosporangium darangshiense TaxID=579108 RepID=UPI0036414F8C